MTELKTRGSLTGSCDAAAAVVLVINTLGGADAVSHALVGS
jgi:hypothetical protein